MLKELQGFNRRPSDYCSLCKNTRAEPLTHARSSTSGKLFPRGFLRFLSFETELLSNKTWQVTRGSNKLWAVERQASFKLYCPSEWASMSPSRLLKSSTQVFIDKSVINFKFIVWDETRWNLNLKELFRGVSPPSHLYFYRCHTYKKKLEVGS